MNAADALDLFQAALWLMLVGAGPPILAATLVGTGVALFQALTQIQEQTLSFGIKLIAVSATILLTARWVGGEMFNFTVQIFDSIPSLGR